MPGMERAASILAVDDDPGILRLIEMTLDDDDFDLQLAHSGEEAIQLAESVELDAILLDIMMPGMTGIEVLEELRRNSNVPVILVSARDANADKVRGLDLGADDYISKPFSVEELRARLRAVLRRSFSREQPNLWLTPVTSSSTSTAVW